MLLYQEEFLVLKMLLLLLWLEETRKRLNKSKKNFKTLGKNIIYVGKSGTGQIVKAL